MALKVLLAGSRWKELLCLLLCSFCQYAATTSHTETFNEANQLRNKEGATRGDLQRAASLFATAGEVAINNPPTFGLTKVKSSAAADDGYHEPLPEYPNVLVGQGALPAALRELAKAFQAGRGVEVHHGLAVELLRRAGAAGDPEAQGLMGVLHAFGLQQPGAMDSSGIRVFGHVDDAQAVLQYYFAAGGGDPLARMALGYRHLYGIGVPRSCWAAVSYLQLVAEEVLGLAQKPSSLPHVERIRLNVQATQGLKADRQKELLQFYQYSADRGNVEAQTTLGQVLNIGVHGLQRDHLQALRYFQRAAEADDPDAMAHLAHMYASGFGTDKDMDTAIKWFEKAADMKQPSAQFALGYVHLTGEGAEVDYSLAHKYFTEAAEQGHPESHFYLGLMHMKGWGVKSRNAQKAFAYFSAASQAGHLLAMYNAAMLHLAGKGTMKKCRPAAALLKQIAEKGPVAGTLQAGHELFFRGQYSGALLSYLAAAEVGMELAQSNAAWMLQQGYTKLGGNADGAAVMLHKRAAEQNNVAALLALGDAYFYGKGVPQDWARSAAIYYEAYQLRSAEAIFNLGFMHEFGAGVPKDLYLARKFYQMTKHKQPDAATPVALACAWVTLHEHWDALRPSLPASLDFIWDRIFVLHPPATSPLGVVADLLAFIPLPQLALHGAMLHMHLQKLPILPLLKSLKDVNDTLLLGALLGCLLLVLKLRARRQANAQLPNGPIAPPPPGPPLDPTQAPAAAAAAANPAPSANSALIAPTATGGPAPAPASASAASSSSSPPEPATTSPSSTQPAPLAAPTSPGDDVGSGDPPAR